MRTARQTIANAAVRVGQGLFFASVVGAIVTLAVMLVLPFLNS